MKYEITLNKVPNQILNFTIEDRQGVPHLCEMHLKEYQPGLLVASLKIDGAQIFASRKVCNMMPLIYSNDYKGNFYFEDFYRNRDPEPEGFNSRWKLLFNTNYRI